MCMKLSSLLLWQKLISIISLFWGARGDRNWISMIQLSSSPTAPSFEIVKVPKELGHTHIWVTSSLHGHLFVLALTRTWPGGWWGTRKPGLISGAGGLEVVWGLTMRYHTDLPKSSLGTTPTLGEPLHPFRLLNVFACCLGCWFTTECPLLHPLPALSLCEFSAILGHLRSQWFSQRTRESVDIFSAILPLPQTYTLQLPLTFWIFLSTLLPACRAQCTSGTHQCLPTPSSPFPNWESSHLGEEVGRGLNSAPSLGILPNVCFMPWVLFCFVLFLLFLRLRLLKMKS